jgi:hypothetical protein
MMNDAIERSKVRLEGSMGQPFGDSSQSSDREAAIVSLTFAASYGAVSLPGSEDRLARPELETAR